MSTITTRAGKGSPLTNSEVDANFTNLNTDKAELSGATFTGEIVANAGIALGDNDKATFGASDDLQVYHDGSNSYVHDNGTGRLFLKANDGVWIRGNNNSTLGTFTQGGAVTLYHNNAQKLATTSTGIDVTGTATMDGLVVGDGHTIGNDGFDNLLIEASSGEGIRLVDNHATNPLTVDSNVGFRVQTILGTDRFFVDNATGDISFYEDTGTTPKLFWDASAERLGIGTSSPARLLTIQASGSQISLLSDTTGSSVINLGDTADDNIGRIQYDNSNDKMVFRTNTVDRLVINSSGRVGIGESDPTSFLSVGGNAITTKKPSLSIVDLSNGGSINIRGLSPVLAFDTTGPGIPKILMDGKGVEFKEGTLDAEGSVAVKIDSSGNLLVGKTSADDFSSAGAQIESGGQFTNSVASAPSLRLNRGGNDGDIIEFNKAGTTVGSIGSEGGDTLYIGTSDTGLRFHPADRIVPHNPATNTARDAAIDLGRASERFKDLYLSGGVYLGGTGAANKLDDYESGTWTPTIVGSTSGSLSTFTVTEATYTKIGDTVRLSCYLSAVNVSTSTVVGTYRIGGLPFVSDPFADAVSVTYCNMFNFDEGTTSISGFCEGSVIRLLKGSSTAPVTDGDDSGAVNAAIMLSVTHKVA